MKLAVLAAVATSVALAGCAAPGTASEERYYRCRVERAAGPGIVTMIVDVEQDGRVLDHDFSWALRSPSDRVQLRVEWTHMGPMTTGDEAIARFTHRRPSRARLVRLVLSPSEGPEPAQVIASPTFGREVRNVSITVPLSRLRDFLAGAPSLTAGIVDGNGRLLGQDRIETADLDVAVREVAAAQPEIEAMAADYRNRCALTEPDRIILT